MGWSSKYWGRPKKMFQVFRKKSLGPVGIGPRPRPQIVTDHIILFQVSFGREYKKKKEIHLKIMGSLQINGTKKKLDDLQWSSPIGSMYGIFTYIYHRNQPNVAKYTIHGSYGSWFPGYFLENVGWWVEFLSRKNCQISSVRSMSSVRNGIKVVKPYHETD